MELESQMFTHKELLLLVTALVTLKDNTAQDDRWTQSDENIYCSLFNRLTNLLECENEVVELMQLVQNEYI